MELTIKDKTVLDIGKSVGKSFEGLANSGKAMLVGPDNLPLKSSEVAETEKIEVQNYQTSILEEISQGIQDLITSFTDMLSFDKKEAAEDDLKEKISQGQKTEMKKESGGEDTGFFTKDFKDMLSSRLSAVKEGASNFFGMISGSLLGKVGLFGLLLAFALNIGKFSKQIGDVLKPIVAGFKSAFTSLKEDFFPFVENLIELLGSAFTTVSDLLKGLFQGDGSAFVSGLKGLLLDLPLRIVSVIGDGFWSLVDATLKFFGVESQMVQDIKMAFRTLPEAVTKFINDSITFITETIPQYFIDLKDQAIENARNNIAAIKDMFKSAFNFITEDIPNYFGNLVDDIIQSIKDTVQSIKDAIMAPIRAVKEKVGGVFSGVKNLFGGGDEEKMVKVNSKDMSLEDAKSLQRKVFDDIHEKRSSGSYTNAEKARMKMYNQLVIDKDPTRGEDHKALNSMNPMLYADYDYRGEDQRSALDFAAGEALNDRNALRSAAVTMNPQNLNAGKQLNTESAELASSSQPQSNMQINKGGTSNINTANNTYTTILEDTNTSDKNLRQYLNS
jgi:hypothetical protein